ncbi:MAG: Ppx/GppA phosphatase family protein [Hyphomicrobium sp.]
MRTAAQRYAQVVVPSPGDFGLKPDPKGPNAPHGAPGQPNSDLGRPPAQGSGARSGHQGAFSGQDAATGPIYGALDLGTNNCRLLLARPSRRGFRVIDAFSRIIRLGEGVSQSGRLSDHAMQRTFDALKVCAGKIERHHVARLRMVATQACRVAANGPDFIEQVKERFALDIEVLTPETEARLAVAGCSSLIDPAADYVLVFDIGGGSSEIIWLDLTRLGARRMGHGRVDVNEAVVAWTSLPVGVVTLAERFDGRTVTPESFAAMSDVVAEMLAPFEAEHRFGDRLSGRKAHLLGTSGTVTTIAGIMLDLPRYDRNRVDGIWMQTRDVCAISEKLLGKSYEERIAEPCIGRERADLVLAGCAILDAILKLWPAERLRVADRGLREGILTTLMIEDGVWRSGRRRRGGARRDERGRGP